MAYWMMLGIFIAIALACTALFLNYRSSRKSATMQKTAVIAGLASDYDLVTYLDDDKKTATNYLVSENFRNIYSHIDPALPSNKRLDALFKAIVHPEDFTQFLEDVDRKKSIKILSTEPSYIVKFRAIINSEVKYYHVKLARDKSKIHGFVLGIRNIDAETRREEETNKLRKDLQITKRIANKDPLTGVGNSSAFMQKIQEWDSLISKHCNPPFAIVECDLNDLKKVNDKFGHEAGDEYLKANCTVFCSIFKHSPVFRIGGDEFAILLTESDFANRDKLIKELASCIENSAEIASKKISFAVGMSDFNPVIDTSLKDSLKRADYFMYEHKRKQKENG